MMPSFRWGRSLVSLSMLLALTVPAQADTNPTPIAVPLMNENDLSGPQPGAPYPSTINIIARGGPGEVSSFSVTLHAVTHPCPEDLALLLVHNDTDKYLLMSHAGSCRPLQGTDLRIRFGDPPVPDADPMTTPYDAELSMGPSNYGSVPVFPAPAPAGPYMNGMPPITQAQGTWQLFVIDTQPLHRGVIAGGWSLNYESMVQRPASNAPATIPLGGVASPYPVTFDFSDVPAGIGVAYTQLLLNLSHGYPDDLHIVLQSPHGNAVVVMAKAGGGISISNRVFNFYDGAVTPAPDSGPLVDGANYTPGSVYESPVRSLPLPAPAAPYATRFAAFDGEELRGVWTLWIWDDFAADGGMLNSAYLTLATQDIFPDISVTAPTTSHTFTATQPFLDVAALLGDATSQYAVTWRNVANGTFYDAGAMAFTGTRATAATIPLTKGSNQLTLRVRNIRGDAATWPLLVTVDEFVYYLSEGATGGFFTEEVTLANPSTRAAPVSIDYLPEHSAPVNALAMVSPFVPLQVHVNDAIPGDGVSTVVHSTQAVPLAVERTMSWNGDGYGAHGGTAVSPNTRWLFAEGSQGYFDTYLLLANDQPAAVDVAVRFLREGGGIVNHPVTVPAHARLTLYAGDVPELVNTSFGIDVSAPQPIIAERAMYFPHGGARIFEGGHESAGANATNTRWFLAEGATGPFFECFVLLSNPTSTIAHATLTYLLPDGTTIPQPVEVPANGRLTIDVETVDPRLANTPVSTIVTADIGIIVERSMYWPDVSVGWTEAHNSFGVTAPALRWAVADGRLGSARGYQTFLLLANPNPYPAQVVVRYLKDGREDRSADYVLPPTSRTTLRLNDTAHTGDGLVSVEVWVRNYQPIIVEKALYWDSGGVTWAAGTGVVGTPMPPP